MKPNISIPRNKTIAKLFRLVKLAENAGFGFDRMNAGWSSFSKTLPEYTAERDFVIVKFFLESVPETVKKTVKKTVEKIMQLMQENPSITISKLSEETGLTRRGIEWNIKKLKEEGKLERIGPDKGGYWKIHKNKN